MVLIFVACLGDSGRESSEKYRVIVPRVVGSDLLDHKRIEHAVASRVRVKGQYQRQHPDDCPRQGRWFVSSCWRPIGLEIGRENDMLG
jgi:hypothetical protein